MAHTQQHIIDVMKRTRIVPLFSTEDAAEAEALVEAAYLGGVRVFEFTNRKSNAYDVFVELRTLTKKYPDLLLGIGTVMDGSTTEKFIDAGADFIISPILKLEMAEVCHAHNVMWIPGCATLTEIVTAKEHGAAVIKVFPGSVLGPGFVSSIIPVVPDLNLMITGGVEPSEQNLAAWFKAGAMCVGLGSQLFSKELVASKDWKEVERQVANALQIAKHV